MAVSIDFKSAKIKVADEDAKPNVATGLKRAVIHLTKGFNGPDADPVSDNNAFEITGDVDVLVDTVAEADDVLNGNWTFSFIQILKVDSVSFTWSGRRDTEGEVFIPLSQEPAWPKANLVCLDGNPGATLFYNSQQHAGFRKTPQPGQKIVVHVKNSMTDHPAIGTGYRIPNSATKSKNFLSAMERELEGFAVFTGRDGAGVLHPIVHVHWHLHTEAAFKWSRNIPTGVMRKRILEFGPPLLALPVDPAVQTLLRNPAPPLHNDLSKTALRNAPRSILSKQDSVTRSLFLPKDFFK
jgi:hypothetical protein